MSVGIRVASGVYIYDIASPPAPPVRNFLRTFFRTFLALARIPSWVYESFPTPVLIPLGFFEASPKPSQGFPQIVR